MSRGGKRHGAGRPKGAKTNKSLVLARSLAKEGLTPLEFMIELMRDSSMPAAMRFEAAKTAAPYMHPKFNIGSFTQNILNVEKEPSMKEVLQQVEHNRQQRAHEQRHANTFL